MMAQFLHDEPQDPDSDALSDALAFTDELLVWLRGVSIDDLYTVSPKLADAFAGIDATLDDARVSIDYWGKLDALPYDEFAEFVGFSYVALEKVRGVMLKAGDTALEYGLGRPGT